jgi:hypothetical protein
MLESEAGQTTPQATDIFNLLFVTHMLINWHHDIDVAATKVTDTSGRDIINEPFRTPFRLELRRHSLEIFPKQCARLSSADKNISRCRQFLACVYDCLRPSSDMNA